jgi:replicative DNA helicase
MSRQASRETTEARVLGAILNDPCVLATVSIDVGDFRCGNHGEIFQALKNVMASGFEPDVFSVTEHAFGSGKGDGLKEVTELYRNSYAKGNIPKYVDFLRGLASLDAMEDLLELAHQTVSNTIEPEKSDAIRAKLITRLSEIGEGSGRRKDFSMAEVMSSTKSHLEAAVEAKKSGRTIGVPTGIKSLDEATSGLHGANLIVVGARPATGKTAFALSVAHNAAKSGYRVGFVSAEMSRDELGQRLISLDSGVPAIGMRDGYLRQGQIGMIEESAARLGELRLKIHDNPSAKLSDIQLQARQWQLRGGVDLIIVDYIQRLTADEKSENRTREVGKFAQGLKTLASQFGVPVMVLSQLNRGVTGRADKRPAMSDLRDSGEIEQEADLVLLLHRPALYEPDLPENEAEIIIDKNRHGPSGITIRSCWESSVMRWG